MNRGFGIGRMVREICDRSVEERFSHVLDFVVEVRFDIVD